MSLLLSSTLFHQPLLSKTHLYPCPISRNHFSVTTNAVDIDPILEVAGKLSSVRVSVDSKLRTLNENLEDRISKILAVHKVGANVLCAPGSSSWVRETISRLAILGAKDFLIIPEHDHGHFILGEKDWLDINKVILDLSYNYQIMVTSDATSKITSSMLETYSNYEYLFAHIDESGNIRRRSWDTPSLTKVRTKNEIISALQQLNPLRRYDNENMV